MRLSRLCLAGLVIVGLLAATGLYGQAAAGKIYEMAIFEDVTTMNVFAQLGPEATVWNSHVGYYQSYIGLTGNALPDLVLAPSAATGMPSPIVEETIGGRRFYTSTLKIRSGMRWSDGKPITADDVVFSFIAPLAMEPNKLGGNWPTLVDPPCSRGSREST
ncbi:MAG: ABC transporter substrate-binding protein, partial [Firmicutes bacterium]|nr:ABC transporter substrate-binding protein [Bacillota bacterium]